MPNKPRRLSKNAVGKIRQALRERGTSLYAWSAQRGYAWRTVYSCVATWAGRTDRAPLGGISRSIMDDLRADLGAEIVPEIKSAA